jgi:hypothetical protein
MFSALCSVPILMMRKPQSVHSILGKTLKSLEIDLPLKAYSIWGAWEGIVGETIAHQARPRVIRNRILFIDVSHSTWMQQLQFLKSNLIQKMNAFIGEPYIQDIRFGLGKIPPPSGRSETGPNWQDETLSEETLRQIDELLQGIGEEEARSSLRAVLIKGAKLERYRKNRT